jgi:hypothetical protein
MRLGRGASRHHLRRQTTPSRTASALSSLRDVQTVRRVVAAVALILGAYCLMAAATALYAQSGPGGADPQELAARERYRWPGLIPVVFLALVVGYVVLFAARRRRGRRAGPPSTQDPPPLPDRRRDTASR